MRSWSAPAVPRLPVTGPEVRLHDSATRGVVTTRPSNSTARFYVCGITPYDATHMGHAATFVGFDLLNRAWRSAGYDVRYVQNVTDVDDPLLERAEQTGEDWVALAERETELLREDLVALRVLPPAHYIGAVESIGLVLDLIARLDELGAVYSVGGDLYFSVTADPAFGAVSGWSRDEMLAVFGDRGGDPDVPGKRDPLDCLLWRAERPGEPAWPSPYGPGRPGWHIECTAIALKHLGAAFDVQGGGSDLIFPHHEMCAAEAQVADPAVPFALAYAHAGMVGYQGEKMSKSKGNLVFVSALRRAGVDPMAIRLTLLGQHYRSDWEWTDALLAEAGTLLDRLRKAAAQDAGAPAGPVLRAVLDALADDLDAPAAVAALAGWADRTLAGDDSDPDAGRLVRDLADAALGLAL